jgi:hypothetical protein
MPFSGQPKVKVVLAGLQLPIVPVQAQAWQLKKEVCNHEKSNV